MWGALGLGILLSIMGVSSGDDVQRIMGTIWLATSVVLASIQRGQK